MGVHTFPKGICPKVNVIARLEYELAYYDSALTITPRGHPPKRCMIATINMRVMKQVLNIK